VTASFPPTCSIHGGPSAQFVVPYQHALETEAGQRNVHLYLQGCCLNLLRKNAEQSATLVDVERLSCKSSSARAP